jgi:two-component system nitrate/nitrite response regulator NarL
MSNRDSKVTVLIVDDHAFFRDGLSRGLVRSGQIAVVAEAGNGREGLEAIRRERPAVAVVDYQMPDMDGIALLHAVIRERLATRVVLLSAFTDSAVVFRALEEGAAGYLSKDADRQDIVDAVLGVARGDTVVPAQLTAGLAGEIRLRAQSQAPALSEREGQVLQAFARGLSIPQTAAELYIEPSTVKTHTQRLYDKLGVSDRAAAVAEAMRRGLLE